MLWLRSANDRSDATTGGNVNLVSSLTIRHVGRPDFLLFALGLASFGSFSLAPELMQLGFSLVMRSLARLGFMILALHSGGSGSSLPSRNFARPDAALLLCGKARLDSILVANGNLYPGFALYFNGPNNYIYYDTVATELRIHAGGLKRMSISSTGGSLHGTWSSESIISASDERLKRRIEPLDRALAARAQPASISPGPPNRAEAVSWLLRELRPVSYYFREGPEAKLARYGFIAQELEKVMPELVRDHKEKKHVVYQDLVALLALSSQVQQERLEEYEAREASCVSQEVFRLAAGAKAPVRAISYEAEDAQVLDVYSLLGGRSRLVDPVLQGHSRLVCCYGRSEMGLQLLGDLFRAAASDMMSGAARQTSERLVRLGVSLLECRQQDGLGNTIVDR
ncbi:unnamed protein product [Effrenium voratum]|nr:unnamed protein product [Effrenium voratum]